MDLGLIVWVVSWVLAGSISAFYWNTRRYLRPLPIIYGLCAGLVVGLFVQEDREIWKILETVIVCGVVGLLLFFAVWVEARSPDQAKRNPQ